MTEFKNKLSSLIIDKIRYQFLSSIMSSINYKESILDLGCGLKPYKSVYEKKFRLQFGIDVPYSPHDQNMIDVFAKGTAIPFKNSSFDFVLCTEVMEHISEPEHLLKEVYRILKKNGKLLITVPFMVPVHEAPHDYYRYTKYGLEYLLIKHNYQIEVFRTFSDTFGVLISFVVQLQSKFWNLVSKKIKFPLISSIYNPFVFLLIFLPQYLYLLIQKSKFISKLLSKFSYTAKGYGIVGIK